MNKPLDAAELKALETAFPVVEPTPVKMTRRQKLLRFADLIEKSAGTFALFHLLEYMGDATLMCHGVQGSALELVGRDPVFQKDGMKGSSVLEVKNYLGLSTEELHEFSCNCGGDIGKREMAERVRRLAGPDPAASVGMGVTPIAIGTAAGLAIAALICTLPFMLA